MGGKGKKEDSLTGEHKILVPEKRLLDIHFMIKTLQKMGREGTYLNIIKTIILTSYSMAKS